MEGDGAGDVLVGLFNYLDSGLVGVTLPDIGGFIPAQDLVFGAALEQSHTSGQGFQTGAGRGGGGQAVAAQSGVYGQ